MGRLLWGAAAALIAAIAADGCAPTSCVTRAECSSGEVCAYKVGSCAAQGQCMSRMGDNFAISEYCGCDGSPVYGGAGAGYADGYASGPTLGSDAPSSTCSMAAPEVDA